MCISALPACIYVCHVCVWCPQRSEGGIRSLGTEISDVCKPPCGCWVLNLGPVEERVVLTLESSLQPHSNLHSNPLNVAFYLGSENRTQVDV